MQEGQVAKTKAVVRQKNTWLMVFTQEAGRTSARASNVAGLILPAVLR